MAKLINETEKNIVVEKLEVANTFWKRLKGLLGQESIEDNYGLWFRRSNSIHTYFMKCDIDAIFLDKNLKVKKCYSNLRPHELVFVWGASSVIEMAAGHAKKVNVKVGDQFNVVH